MTFIPSKLPAGGCLILMLFLAACSPIMEATRDTPVNISRIKVGESRASVMNQIGSPISTTVKGEDTCDIYQLCTSGPGNAGKGAIAAGELIADVFTFGLAELIFTPVEVATRDCPSSQVLACYNHDNKLTSIAEMASPTIAAPEQTTPPSNAHRD